MRDLKMLHNRFLTYLLIAVFVISAVFTACNKPDDVKVQLLKTLTFYNYNYSKSYTYRCVYDDKNRITSIVDETDFQIVYQFEYSGNDLVELRDGTQKYLDFSKNGNIITVLYDGLPLPYWTIELNSNGYPIKVGPYTLQYLNGNVISASTPYVEYTFKYDNKKSPFYHCKTPKWFQVCFCYITDWILEYPFAFGIENNLKNYTVKDYKYEYENTYDYTYEYDDSGFPTKMYENGKLDATFTY